MNYQNSFQNTRSTLYLVATPIGNLSDITLRAIETLEQVDTILAEDTRVSSKLLNYYKIKKPLISYHEFNKTAKIPEILKLLSEGQSLALITDAGTPAISDPGYEVAKAVVAANFNVVAIPGASAILTALVSSALIPQPFSFLGFLPRKKSEVIRSLEPFKSLNHTLVIYEAPKRIKETIQLLTEVFTDRPVAVIKELTKKFETIIRTNLKQLTEFEFDERGEYVIVVEGNHTASNNLEHLSIDQHVMHYLKNGMNEKEALKMVAKDRKTTKSEIYKIYKIK